MFAQREEALAKTLVALGDLDTLMGAKMLCFAEKNHRYGISNRDSGIGLELSLMPALDGSLEKAGLLLEVKSTNSSAGAKVYQVDTWKGSENALARALLETCNAPQLSTLLNHVVTAASSYASRLTVEDGKWNIKDCGPNQDVQMSVSAWSEGFSPRLRIFSN